MEQLVSTPTHLGTGHESDRSQPPRSVLFVCTANVCRSPACQAVMEGQLARRGLAPCFRVDSAGVLDDLVGYRAPWRMRWAAFVRGYRIRGRARRVSVNDLNRFDWIIAMDWSVLIELRKLTPSPRARIRLLTEFLPEVEGSDIADPMFGPWSVTWRVLDQFEEACPRIIDALLQAPDPASGGEPEQVGNPA